MSLTRYGRSRRPFSSRCPGNRRRHHAATHNPLNGDDQRCLLTTGPSYEPHGFEGLARLLIEADMRDLAIAKREQEGASRGHLDAVPASLVSYVRDDDRLTSVYVAVCLDSNRLKGVEVALI